MQCKIAFLSRSSHISGVEWPAATPADGTDVKRGPSFLGLRWTRGAVQGPRPFFLLALSLGKKPWLLGNMMEFTRGRKHSRCPQNVLSQWQAGKLTKVLLCLGGPLPSLKGLSLAKVGTLSMKKKSKRSGSKHFMSHL